MYMQITCIISQHTMSGLDSRVDTCVSLSIKLASDMILQEKMHLALIKLITFGICLFKFDIFIKAAHYCLVKSSECLINPNNDSDI